MPINPERGVPVYLVSVAQLRTLRTLIEQVEADRTWLEMFHESEMLVGADEVALERLSSTLQQLHATLKALYVAVAGTDPWSGGDVVC